MVFSDGMIDREEVMALRFVEVGVMLGFGLGP